MDSLKEQTLSLTGCRRAFPGQAGGKGSIFQTIMPAALIRQKDHTGFCASYEAEGNRYYPDKQYYEELHDISLKTGELNFIKICVETTAEYGIRKAMEDPDVVRLLSYKKRNYRNHMNHSHASREWEVAFTSRSCLNR